MLTCASNLAQPGGELWLLHVAAPDPDFIGYEVGPQSVRDAVASKLRGKHKRMQELAAPLQTAGLGVTPLTVQGVVVERILEHAARVGAELIVLASSSHGAVHELIAGSVVRGVLHDATVPVVVVPAHAPGS